MSTRGSWFALVYASVFLGISGCCPNAGEATLTSITSMPVTGFVKPAVEKKIPQAVITINDQRIATNRDGKFTAKVAPAASYLVSATAAGFGLYSKKFRTLPDTLRIRLSPGSTESKDPTKPIRATNRRRRDDCDMPLSSKVDWRNYPQQAMPRVYSAAGQYIGSTISADVAAAISYISNKPPCSQGIAISLPANSLVDKDGKKPEGAVDVNLTTIDLMAPGAMPGDYTVIGKNGTSYMRSYGAGIFSITADGREYQPIKGSVAEVTIPVAPTSAKSKNLPKEIPLLYFDEAMGIWREDGVGYLNETRDAYVGKLSHFSAFNMDALKVNQSCIRIKSDGIDGSFRLEASWMEDEEVVIRDLDITNALGDRLHTLYNLPNNTDIILRPFRIGAFSEVPLGTFVVNSGPPQNPTDPNEPEFPYTACQAEITLTEDVEVPVMSGPAYEVFGNFDIHAFYSWPAGVHGPGDGYLLQESEVDGSWPTPPVAVSDVSGSHRWTLTRSPGEYFFRAQVIENSTNTAFSNVIRVEVVPNLKTKLNIINKMADSNVADKFVLRLRIGHTIPEAMAGSAEKLEPDDYCEPSEGDGIGPGENNEIDVGTYGTHYFVALGLGTWLHDITPCTSGYSKGLVDDTGLYNYIVLQVTGQNAGTFNIELTEVGGQVYANGQSFITSGVDPFE